MAHLITASVIRDLAAECGFPLAGVVRATPVPDFDRFRDWATRGLAGNMHYLTDHRAEIRHNPEQLLAGVNSIVCVGMPYCGPEPYSIDFSDSERGWIARYAWGSDYHPNIRDRLSTLARKLLQIQEFSWRACVDTAPLLERSLARNAGLGWIGKNTCLINQAKGSWFLLGELLTTLDLAPDSPVPDRCGTCSRCIDACPTTAIVPSPAGGYELDSRLCISYFTIELRDSVPLAQREKIGSNIFGCDICQDVCPWNRKREVVDRTADPSVPLERMAALSEEEFRRMFRGTAVSRAKYAGFLRNVAVAMGNSGAGKFRVPLEKLAASGDPLVAEHACWALHRLTQSAPHLISSEQTQ